MYVRIALSLWGDGMWVTGRSVSATAGTLSNRGRPAGLPCRWLHAGTALRSDKSESPEEGSPAKQDEESKEKPTESATKDGLLQMIGSMKVEVSSKSRFQTSRFKDSKTKEESMERDGNLESTRSMFQKAVEESQKEDKPLNPDLVAAVTAVASSLPLNQKLVQSELLQQLRKHEQETDVQRKAETQISDIIADMKISKHPASKLPLFGDSRQEFTSPKGVAQEFSGFRSRSGLYTGKRLNMFPVIDKSTQPTGTESSPSLWDMELANQIASVCEQPPRNGFEEMIQWTKEGKLWTFPINNEAGLEEEQKVEFHEHVFLDKYLEDFPRQGPIRHFMELVVCGLSKNPYFTVQQKKDHIEWFQNYFEQKKDILSECNVQLN
uniref:Small ribosomal subunit protein mS31 n=1 Tax=Leptobrachium leishanense TaxID=445787 RepID=A0A8C5P8A1_9ANUR